MKKIDLIRKQIKTAPQSPGVYYWLGEKGEVLYVGRSVNLRSRLSQYLLSNVAPKTKELVSSSVAINYQVCDSLLEAIILESKEIKHYLPKYNVSERDNRSFIYVVIPKKDYTAPILVRGHNLKKYPLTKVHIFGPYQSYQLIKQALRLLRAVFPYSTCQANSGKPCFDYQIGLCPGTCLGKISASDYQKNIDNLVLMLSGGKKRLLKQLKRDNPLQAKALQHLQDVSLLAQERDLREESLARIEAYDISHLAGKESYGAMVVFSAGEANTDEYRLFKIKASPAHDDERALAEVIRRRFAHLDWPRPDLILVDGGKPQVDFISRVLAELNLNLPLVGISEYGSDKLVFARNSTKEIKLLAKNIKPTLLKARNEAHRFANLARNRSSRITKGK